VFPTGDGRIRLSCSLFCHVASFGHCYARIDQVRRAISRESKVRKGPSGRSRVLAGVGLGKVDKGGGSPAPGIRAVVSAGATISCEGRRIAQGP
jgi:hypothetical protein